MLAVAAAVLLNTQTVVVFDAWQLLQKDTSTPAARLKRWEELHALSALQGIVNRDQPRLYLNLVGDKGSIDRYWWRYLSAKGRWMADAKVVELSSLKDLVVRFRPFLKGLVEWHASVPATSSVASTIAGVEDLLPVASDGTLAKQLPLEVKLVLPRFDGKKTGSPKCDAYAWAIEHYLSNGKCSPRKMGYYPDAFWVQRPNGLPLDRTLLSNHDYFIAKRGFFFDLSSWNDESPDDDPNQPLGADVGILKQILLTAYFRSRGQMIHVGGFTPWDLKYTDFTGKKHGGVETEWRYAEILSCYNAYMDADAPGLGPMANASFFMHFPLRDRYPQPALPSEGDMQRKGWLDQHGKPAKKAFAAFYVGDYDSAAWLYRMLPEVWDDKERGSIPLGWAFNPNLEERFPVGLHYTRETATPNDTFITGDSGAGYLNPGYLMEPRTWSGLKDGLDAWIRHCEPFYKRWDLKVSGFIIDGFAPAMPLAELRAYAKLSPGGVVAQKIPETMVIDDTPFLRMGSDLNGGDMKWSLEKVKADAKTPGFRLYRTILWTASKHNLLVDQAK
jgi:hypothetical protein